MERILWLMIEEKTHYGFLFENRNADRNIWIVETTNMQESSPKPRIFDLEERTIRFAQNIRGFVKKLSVFDWNVEDKKQLVRSSGAIGANYIEANKSLGKRDFLMRTRTSRKGR